MKGLFCLPACDRCMSKNNRKKEKKGGLHGKSDPFIGRGRHKMIIRQCNLPCPQLYITLIVQPFPSPPSPSTGKSPLGQHGLIVNSFTVSDDLSVNKHGFVYHIAV